MKTKTKAYRFDSAEQLKSLVSLYGEYHFAYVPPLYCTSGFLYEANGTRDGNWTSAKDLSDPMYADLQYVSFADAKKNTPIFTLEAKIEKAKSFVGKNVVGLTSVAFTVKSVEVIISEEQLWDRSLPCSLEFNKHGIAIIVIGDGYSLPFDQVKLSDSFTLNLNSNHTATIFKDKVVVGCQTFSREKIEQLYNIMQSIK